MRRTARQTKGVKGTMATMKMGRAAVRATKKTSSGTGELLTAMVSDALGQ